jgi:hypothetical protein
MEHVLAVQYIIEVSKEKRKPKLQFWVDQVFAKKPNRPGYWDFNWEPGHGTDVFIREQVSFDKARQLFVDKQKIQPYRGTAFPK